DLPQHAGRDLGDPRPGFFVLFNDQLVSPVQSALTTRAGHKPPRTFALAGGPLSLPGRPLTFVASCSARAILVSVPEWRIPFWAAGPFLFPAKPAIPAPEFCALGAAICGIPAPDFCTLGT